MQSDPLGWWYRFYTTSVATVTALIGVGLAAGPGRWTRSNSLQKLHDYVGVPWPAWGAAFLLVALGLLWTRTRVLAWVAGFALGAFFIGLALQFSVITGQFTNPVTIGYSMLGILSYGTGMRYATLRHAVGLPR